MKQKFFLTLLFMIAATTANAIEIMVDGIYYSINGNEASVSYSPDKYSGEITIPEVVTYHGVSYPVTAIGLLAFNQCSGLTKVSIPNSVTTFEEGAFMHCSGLTEMTISSNVTFIGKYALAYCSGLTSIVVPNSVTFIDCSAFEGCTSVTSMTVESGNPMYDSRDNCNAIIETASNTLISACNNTIMPNSVTSIGDWAFGRLEKLSSITIYDSITSIGNEAFYGCNNLRDVYSYIADPSRVPIGNGAFYTFGHYSNRTLHVPAGTSALYKASDSWNPYFSQIVEMPGAEVNCDLNGDGVVNIADINIVVNYILTHE